MSIRHFKIELTAEGPIHIGNGKDLKKKDYFSNGKSISILDVPRFVGRLDAEQLRGYCEFLETDSRTGLDDFFKKFPNLRSVADECVAYTVNNSFARARRGSYQFLPVKEFIKDAYGCPYVPGSSVKGVLRTAILASIVQDDAVRYEKLYDGELARGYDRKNADKKIVRRAFWKAELDKNGDNAVNDIMRYVSVSDSEPLSTGDLVFVKKYDKFSKADDGSHKKDMDKISNASYYEGNELNIYRECLKPGTRICLNIDVESKIDDYLDGWQMNAAGIRKVLEDFYALYKECFLDHFELGDSSEGEAGGGSAALGDGKCQYIAQTGPLAGRRCPNNAVNGTGYCNKHQDKAFAANAQDDSSEAPQCWCLIGGGVDFASKTILNALFDDDAYRLRETSHVLYNQFTTKIDRDFDKGRHDGLWHEVEEAGFEPRYMKSDYGNGRLKKAKEDHRHWRDREFGVSPHTVKLGILNGKKYPMGKCAFKIREV